MSVFARWMSMMFVVCLVGVSGARVVARRDPPPDIARLLPDEACPVPCWAGLQPGHLPAETLNAWLAEPPEGWRAEQTRLAATAAGVIDHWQITPQSGAPFVLGVVRLRAPVADAIHLRPAGLSLGEVIAALGEPDSIVFSLGPDRDGVPTLEYRAVFHHGFLAAAGLIPVDASHLTVSAPVEALIYEATPGTRSVLAHDWRGFGPMTRYYPQGVVP
jgi:hypothetical protein